jgi:aspartate racemase
MKKIGLLGGMSWESSSHYYQLLNRGIAAQLGGLHSADIIMISVDFHPVEALMRQNDWASITQLITDAAIRIEEAGAEVLLLCTNTMHKVADSVVKSITIPFMHIADVTARKIAARGMQSVGLLGTSFTMQEKFYTDRLEENFGLRILTPPEEQRRTIDRIIFNELCRGKIKQPSREYYLESIRDLQARGAEGIILGCTEIGMLISQDNTPLPLFDTTMIHVEAAIDFALGRV